MELYDTLKSIFGKRFVRTNIASPLWHCMMFELCYDKVYSEFLPIGDDFDKVVPNSKEVFKVKKTKLKADESIERIAVCLFGVYCYTSNTKKLLGTPRRVVNSLKLEGYKVILVDFFEWNKMSMRDDKAKFNYVLKLFEEQGIMLNKSRKNPQTEFFLFPGNHNVLT